MLLNCLTCKALVDAKEIANYQDEITDKETKIKKLLDQCKNNTP